MLLTSWRSLTWRPKWSHKCSMGERSGDLAGHCNTLMLWMRTMFWVCLAVCGQCANKVFLLFDKVIYFMTPCDPNQNLSKVSWRQKFGPIFKSTEREMWHLERQQVISLIWPTDLVYDLMWPELELMRVSSRPTFWPIIKSIEQEMWPLEHQQGIYFIWPGDLVYDSRWLKQIQGFIKTKILTNFQVN